MEGQFKKPVLYGVIPIEQRMSAEDLAKFRAEQEFQTQFEVLVDSIIIRIEKEYGDDIHTQASSSEILLYHAAKLYLYPEGD